MVDKNIRLNYSKLKMLVCIDHESTHEESRMSTIEEIAAKGEILVDLRTSFPSEKVADIGNFRSPLYYYGLLTMCGIRGDMIKICISNHCVREQYFGFLRDYYQKQSSTDLHYLSVMFTNLAYNGDMKRYPDIEHSYILELKYTPRMATDSELEVQAKEGRQQLLQYSKDRIAQKLAARTTLHRVLFQFQGWDMVKCEEIQ